MSYTSSQTAAMAAGIPEDGGNITDVGRHTGYAAGHRFPDGVGEALPDRGQRQNVQAGDDRWDVSPLAQEIDPLGNPKFPNHARQRLILGIDAGSDEDIAHLGMSRRQLSRGPQESRVVLHRVVASDETDEEVLPDTQLRAKARASLRIRPETIQIETIRDHPPASRTKIQTLV